MQARLSGRCQSRNIKTLLALLPRSSLALYGYHSHRVPTPAGRIHVLEARGRGPLPPVVLLHGIASAGMHLIPLLHRLRGRVRHLIAPDLPAHGLSDAPEVMNVDTMKEGLLHAMDAVMTEPAVIFGNSMGGAAAIHYALARPSRVRGVILASPSGAPMDGAEIERFVRTFELGSHRDALEFVDRVFARRNRLRHVFAWGVRRQFENPGVRGLLASLKPHDLLRPEQLAALQMPVLVLWGKDERILPRAHYEFFRRHLPGHARFEEPDGLGHAPYLDDVGAVARQILSFVADVQHRPPTASRLSCHAPLPPLAS